MTEDLLKLAEQCEAATGPDAALDSDIWRTVFGRGDDEDPAFDPEYTASLDAAMSLVPERAIWDTGVTDYGNGIASVFLRREDGTLVHGGCITLEAATPALALVAAAIRARAAALQGEG